MRFELESKPPKASMILDEILEEVHSLVVPLLKKAVASCKEAHEHNLVEFAAIFREYWERLNQADKREIPLIILLQELEPTLQKNLEWTKTLRYLDQHTSAFVWGEWNAYFKNLLEGLPSSQEVAVQRDSWKAGPEDSIKVRLWKRFKRWRSLFKAYGLKINNHVRSLLDKPPLQLAQDRRSIPLHGFLNNYVALPIAHFLLQERQHLLRRVGLQLHQLHQDTERMIDELLGLANTKELCSTSDSQHLMTELKKIRGQTPAVGPYTENLETFEGESLERFKDYLDRLHLRLLDAWEYADTFVLPNSTFEERKNLKRWELIEKDLEKSRQAWQLYFEGEQEDWKKDVELSLHQIQSTLICIDTGQTLNQKIEKQILPSLAETETVIAESLAKLQNADIDEAELKDMILTENRSMLRSLRRFKLPSMTDAVVQAQIDKTLENYLLRIKHSAESLPDQHVILHEVDLNKLPPDSKIMEIALKDLILEEFFSELSRKHNALAVDIDQRLQEILRDISELDQIVEFNLEAALDLLQQREEPEPMGDARSVITEGLGRAISQIDDLTKKNKKVIEISQETLVRIMLEYRGQIQDLADNEKIIELKIRAARAKAKEQIRDYQKRVLQNIKTALPSILDFLSTSLGEIRSGYLRIRKITGLAPSTVKIEEPLSQFIAEQQNQIARLPYVYQRLFRIEPLTDERFFEGRAGEMKILKEEFDSWRAGHYGVTALVGEKGSGRTTLVNFATNKVYNKLSCLKINLQQMTPRTEKGLFMALKEIFKGEEVESIDRLENQINGHDEQRILIVEDLQNLFIRTVDGFDALERFLLFISRTYKRIHWITTCNLYSWQYLDKVIHVSKYFQRVVFMGQLTKQDIESIILKRHRVSGYKLRFEIPEQLMKSRRFKKETAGQDPQEYCKNLLFEQLHELGAGNVTVTMLFWLSAIKKIEKDALVLLPSIDFDYSVLYQLSPEEQFTLSALLQHETLNAEEHAAIFREEIRQSLLLLNRMSAKGVLVGNLEGSYKINPLLYRLVVQALKLKNILH
jgi:AAA domain